MKRVVNIDKEYKMKPQTAINRFFKNHPELEYWKETFEWMLETAHHTFDDTVMADGTRNTEWSYALHLDINEDYTYIAVIERA